MKNFPKFKHPLYSYTKFRHDAPFGKARESYV